MSEILLAYQEGFYLLSSNDEHQLFCSFSKNGKIETTLKICEQPVDSFAADLDDSGALHILVYTRLKALILFVLKEGKITSSNLARINAADQKIHTPFIVCAEDAVSVYYIVENSFGSAAVCYKKISGSWVGNKLFSSSYILSVLTFDKKNQKLILQEHKTDGYKLIEFKTSPVMIAASSMPYNHVQSCHDLLIYENIDQISFNGYLLVNGANPCLYMSDNDILLLYIKSSELYILVNQNGVWQPPALYLDKEATAHIKFYRFVTTQTFSILPSSAFPDIRLPCADSMIKKSGFSAEDKTAISVLQNKTSVLEEEIYILKRSVFTLQAEVKALKANKRQ